jgi:hypothetical protein
MSVLSCHWFFAGAFLGKHFAFCDAESGEVFMSLGHCKYAALAWRMRKLLHDGKVTYA